MNLTMRDRASSVFSSFAKGMVALGLSAIALPAATTTEASAQAGGRQWVKICTKVQDNDICNVRFDIITDTRQLVTSVNLLQSKGKNNRRIFQVVVPTGRIIPAGIKVQIDTGKENTLPYSICLPDRCLAEIPLSAALVKALKNGGGLTLTSTNFRGQKNPVKVTLKGFTASYDGPPIKQEDLEARNKKIAEELQNKAKESLDKLKAAQEAAKKAGSE